MFWPGIRWKLSGKPVNVRGGGLFRDTTSAFGALNHPPFGKANLKGASCKMGRCFGEIKRDL